MGNDNLLDAVKKAISKFVKDDIEKENFVFKLHRVFTVIFLIIWSVVFGLQQVCNFYTLVFNNNTRYNQLISTITLMALHNIVSI